MRLPLFDRDVSAIFYSGFSAFRDSPRSGNDYTGVCTHAHGRHVWDKIH